MKVNEILKQQAAHAALEYAKKHRVLGIGTGSTVDFFIDQLVTLKSQIDMVVSSSEKSTKKLRQLGFLVVDLNYIGSVPVYIDGADEIDAHKRMLKGGGGAHTREKIMATASHEFICMVDSAKQVAVLGKFPVAIEVLPSARGLVARTLLTLGGDPVWRENFITDNGNSIIDVYNLDLTDPVAMEIKLKTLTGVVDSGIFAQRRADKVICASATGVTVL